MRSKSRLAPVLSVLVVLLAHLALLWLLSRPVPMPEVKDRREWVQLLLPIPARQQPVIETKPIRAAKPDAPAAKAPSLAIAAEPALPTPAAPSVAELSAPTEDPAPRLAASTIPAEVLREAIKAAVAAERQPRAEPVRTLAPAPDSMQARLAKGLAAARAAVKPKLFEAPRTELISAPNDPKRIYRVTTGMGEYCLYYPDKGGISANSDPRSGRPEFGQPMASSCPIPF